MRSVAKKSSLQFFNKIPLEDYKIQINAKFLTFRTYMEKIFTITETGNRFHTGTNFTSPKKNRSVFDGHGEMNFNIFYKKNPLNT